MSFLFKKKGELIAFVFILVVIFKSISYYETLIASETKEIEILVDGERYLQEAKVERNGDSLYIPMDLIKSKVDNDKKMEFDSNDFDDLKDDKYVLVNDINENLEKEIVWTSELNALGIGCNPLEEYSRRPFEEKDISAVGLSIGMKGEKVSKIYGSPKKAEGFSYRFGEGEIWDYDFGEVIFYKWEDKLLVNDIVVKEPGYKGPRNIQVGDQKETVTDKFYQENQESVMTTGTKETNFESISSDIEPRMETIYGTSTHNTTGGTLYFDDKGNVDKIIYVVADEGMWPYGFLIDIDEDGRVESFTLTVEMI